MSCCEEVFRDQLRQVHGLAAMVFANMTVKGIVVLQCWDPFGMSVPAEGALGLDVRKLAVAAFAQAMTDGYLRFCPEN